MIVERCGVATIMSRRISWRSLSTRRISFIPLIALLVGAFSGDTSSVDGRDWIEINAGDRFILSAPPGTTYLRLRGVDSFVGEFVNSEFRVGLPYSTNFALSFDYGSYSYDLHSEREDPRFITEQIGVDGRVGTLVSSRNRGPNEFCNGDSTAMHVVARRRLRTGVPVTWLYIGGCVQDEDQIPIVRRMFQSIRFPQP